MKKLYFFDESERERILNLHESATKNQYLINEQSTDKDIASRIYKASYGPGTGSDFLDAIQSISSLQQLKNVDALLKSGYGQLGLQGQINDEFNPQEATDRASLTAFQSHLAKLGATMTFDQNRNESVVINYQSTVQAQPEAQKTEEQQVADWSQKFPCVVNYPGAQKIANTRTDTNVSGTVAYKIGEFTYYIDGKQYGKGSYSTYSCDDAFFKDSSRVQASPENNKGTTTPQPYKHAKHVTNVQNKLKEIDPSFAGGTTSTGQMDQATINKLMEILMSKKTPETKVETPTPEGPTPETGV
jgi:hypothetical protein